MCLKHNCFSGAFEIDLLVCFLYKTSGESKNFSSDVLCFAHALRDFDYNPVLPARRPCQHRPLLERQRAERSRLRHLEHERE